MGKKYIVLFSVILALSFILVMTLMFKDKGYALPKLKELKSDVSSIKIIRGDNSISIKKPSDTWIIDEQYIADSNIMAGMVSAIANLRASDLVSRGDSDVLNRYELNTPSTIVVEAYDDKVDLLRKFALGSQSSLSMQTYGQLDKDKNVYLLTSSQNLRNVFDKGVSEIRNKTIASISSYLLESVLIVNQDAASQRPGEEHTLTKVTPPATDSNAIAPPPYWQISDTPIDNDISTASLSTLSYVIASGFLDAQDATQTEILYKITLLGDGQRIEWTLHYPDEFNRYEVSVEGDNTRFYLDETSASNIVEAIYKLINNSDLTDTTLE